MTASARLHPISVHRLPAVLTILAFVCGTVDAHATTAPAGQKTLSLRANAYHDTHTFFDTDPGDLTGSVSALDVTGDSGGAGLYGSTQQAWAEGSVTATSIGVYSRSYTYAQSASPLYSAFANAYAHASVNTPFLVQGGGTPGTWGTLVATLFVSGAVHLDPALYDEATFAEARGEASMYFWATGLNASGCSYYTDAGCLAIKQVTQFHPGVGTTADTLIDSNNPIHAWTLNIPFQFGDWSSFNLQMWSDTKSFVTAPGTGGWIQHYTESDFGHTLRWGGVSAVLDANGQPVSGWNIESLQGVDLRVAAVPEPEAAALMLAGLALVAWSARRRR